MPTYQYACTECGDRLEVVQSFSDDPLAVCRVCGGKLRKVFSPVGIVFKGSGFYRTDSRRKDGVPAEAGTAAADGKGEAAKGKTGAKDGAASGSPASSSPGTDKAGSASPGSGSSGSGGAGKSSSAATGSKVA